VDPEYARGQRLFLRPVEAGDAALLVRWLNDPEVTQYLARTFPLTMEEEQAWIRNRAGDEKNLVLMIVAREGRRPVGTTGLHALSAVDRKAVFGIQIGEKDCWNRGLGTEATDLMLELAFQRLNLNRVELDVYDTNPRAIRVYERAGFRTEGLARQARFQNGQYVDIRRMAVLAEEWRAKRSPVASEVCQT
jgi:RimJ/RimL family protein N-acetyltransferase